MPRFNSINFYQNMPKIVVFAKKKYKIFECWGLRPQTPVTAPPHYSFLVTRLAENVNFCYLWFNTTENQIRLLRIV